MLKVEGQSDLYRDENTMAIINTNDAEYKSYIQKRNLRMNQKQEIDNLKNDVDEIKHMLSQILKKIES